MQKVSFNIKAFQSPVGHLSCFIKVEQEQKYDPITFMVFISLLLYFHDVSLDG